MKIVVEMDTITPDLKLRLGRLERPGPALRDIGQLAANWGRDAFRNASKRPQAWAPLKPATVKKKKGRGTPLVLHGVLKRSPRLASWNDKEAVVVADRETEKGHSIAAIHQLGAPKARIPPRPFMPFYASGEGLPRFVEKGRKILQRWLEKGVT